MFQVSTEFQPRNGWWKGAHISGTRYYLRHAALPASVRVIASFLPGLGEQGDELVQEQLDALLSGV